MSGDIPPLPNTHSWRGAQLKHRDNFTFTLLSPTGPSPERCLFERRISTNCYKHKYKEPTEIKQELLIYLLYFKIVLNQGRIHFITP
jgi:hypothetical protein